MRSIDPTDVPPYFWTISTESTLEGGERDRRVGAAEAERIRDRGADWHRSRNERHEIQVALGIYVDQVRGGRRNLVADREHGEDRLDTAGRTEQMSRHRFRRGHRQSIRVLAECAPDRNAFGDVAEGRRRP